MNILDSILDWQIIPGYSLGSFSWWIALIVIGCASLVATTSVFLVKYVFGYMRMTPEEIQEARELKKEIKLKKVQRKKLP